MQAMSATPTSALSLSPTMIISGSLAFVVGLAWNDAIQTGIDEYYPNKNHHTFSAKFGYAIIITIVMIMIIATVNKLYGTVSTIQKGLNDKLLREIPVLIMPQKSIASPAPMPRWTPLVAS